MSSEEEINQKIIEEFQTYGIPIDSIHKIIETKLEAEKQMLDVTAKLAIELTFPFLIKSSSECRDEFIALLAGLNAGLVQALLHLGQVGSPRFRYAVYSQSIEVIQNEADKLLKEFPEVKGAPK